MGERIGRRVLVIGSGHSATNTLLDLCELAASNPNTAPIWAIRRTTSARSYKGLDDDALSGRGRLGRDLEQAVIAGHIELVTDFKLAALEETETAISAIASSRTIRVDEIVASTGQRPDLSMTRELRLDLDPSLEAPRLLAPLIDPNVHSCATVPVHGVEQLSHPEPGFYTVGIKSYGRAPTFLMSTGYEQVRSVVKSIASQIARIEQVGAC